MGTTITIGWLKDVLAVFGFCVIMAIVTFRYETFTRRTLLSFLALCMVVDGLFSVNRAWHCSHVGYNAPTMTMALAGVGYVYILVDWYRFLA